MDKEDVVDTQWYTAVAAAAKSHQSCPTVRPHYSIIKKNEILSFATTQMDPKSAMLSEINHTKKDKYYMLSFKCGI